MWHILTLCLILSNQTSKSHILYLKSYLNTSLISSFNTSQNVIEIHSRVFALAELSWELGTTWCGCHGYTLATLQSLLSFKIGRLLTIWTPYWFILIAINGSPQVMPNFFNCSEALHCFIYCQSFKRLTDKLSALYMYKVERTMSSDAKYECKCVHKTTKCWINSPEWPSDVIVSNQFHSLWTWSNIRNLLHLEALKMARD